MRVRHVMRELFNVPALAKLSVELVKYMIIRHGM